MNHPHGASHLPGGGDEIKPEDIGAVPIDQLEEAVATTVLGAPASMAEMRPSTVATSLSSPWRLICGPARPSELCGTRWLYIPDFDAVDAYGDIQPGTETATTYPARFEQLDSEETARDRDTIVARWRVFLPAGAVVNGFARVVDQDGRHFRSAGRPR